MQYGNNTVIQNDEMISVMAYDFNQSSFKLLFLGGINGNIRPVYVNRLDSV